MPKPLKVLMSAYACEPGKGSEPEVGWQWALQMARFHSVTVLTRRNNRKAIEAGLSSLPDTCPRPEFLYYDGPAWQLTLKARLRAVQLYYVLWQRSAARLVAALHQKSPFELLHHATFAAFRYPTAIWGHGAPTIWGPVGGIENVPPHLLPWKHPKALLVESARNWHNHAHALRSPAFGRRLRQSTIALATTREMRRAMQRRGAQPELMPTIGLHTSQIPFAERCFNTGPLRLLFVGNFLTLKGMDLGIEALHRAGTDATLSLVGDGPQEPHWKALVARLGIAGRVHFLGRLPRREVLDLYPKYDVFLFPALHDTGGYAVIEAMLNQLPVICLDSGGPAVSVQDDCGIRVALRPRDTVVHDLAAAIRLYDRSRDILREHATNARGRVLRDYDWDSKGKQMDAIYRRAVETA